MDFIGFYELTLDRLIANLLYLIGRLQDAKGTSTSRDRYENYKGEKMDSQSKIASRALLGEDLCLDCINPVIADGEADFFLSSYARLLDWGVAVGTVSRAEATLLNAKAERLLDAANSILEYARSTCRVLREILASRAKEERLSADLDLLNEAYFRAIEHRRLALVQGQFTWKWISDGDLGTVFWPVVPAAVDLLSSSDLSRLKSCDGCSWLFLDASKNHSRRWCRMKDCGNREKMRSYRQRKGA